MTLDLESTFPFLDDGDQSLVEMPGSWPILESQEPWHLLTPATRLLLVIRAFGMWPSLRTECCHVGQQQSQEHFDRRAVFASVEDILVVHFLGDFVCWQQRKLRFPRVEELLVAVDDRDVDTEDVRQHCSEDVEQVVEVIGHS